MHLVEIVPAPPHHLPQSLFRNRHLEDMQPKVPEYQLIFYNQDFSQIESPLFECNMEL